MTDINETLADLLRAYRAKWEAEHGEPLPLDEIVKALNARLTERYGVTIYKSQVARHIGGGRYYTLELPILRAYSDFFRIPYAEILHAANALDPAYVSPEALRRAIEETAEAGAAASGSVWPEAHVDTPYARRQAARRLAKDAADKAAEMARAAEALDVEIVATVPDEPVHAREQAARRAEKYAEAKRADKADNPTTDKDHEITILCPTLVGGIGDALRRAA